jgi:hypothetical protein
VTRPYSKPEEYIRRYEGAMYKNSTTTLATSRGWELGVKYAKSQGGLSLEDLITISEHMTIPQSMKARKVYKLAFVLSYLKQLNAYKPEDLDQQATLDKIIAPES